ncbi:MAG: hypothetical protein ACRCYU_12395 [Nocardioides sp.]
MSSYSRDSIERLLPCLWDENKAINGIPNPLAPAADMPKGPPPNPSHAGGHWVAVADMRRAWEWAELTLEDRQVLCLKFGLDSTLSEMQGDLGINRGKVQRRLYEAVGRMGLFLNGRAFDARDIDDEEEE